MMQPAHFVTISILFSIPVSCNDVSDESDFIGGSDVGISATGDATRGCSVRPTLTDLSEKYFSFSCAFGGCHDERAAGGLNLLRGGLHARLVGIAASNENAQARGKLRVVPGDPDASFLVQKLEGTQARDEGKIQPDGADQPIDPNCRIKMLRQWISDSAPDN